MSKYIIKNCPCYFKEGDCCWDGTEEFECQNCTDCKMKKIVEECNNAKMRASDYYKNPYSGGVYNEANRILQLLEIEEVE